VLLGLDQDEHDGSERFLPTAARVPQRLPSNCLQFHRMQSRRSVRDRQRQYFAVGEDRAGHSTRRRIEPFSAKNNLHLTVPHNRRKYSSMNRRRFATVEEPHGLHQGQHPRRNGGSQLSLLPEIYTCVLSQQSVNLAPAATLAHRTKKCERLRN